jgi:hypothetical protein
MSDKDEIIRKHLISCGIGRGMWQHKLTDFKTGAPLREYLKSKQFPTDVGNGGVFQFLGTDSTSTNLFWAFSKEAALLRVCSTHCLSLHGLISVLKNDTDRIYDKLTRADLLCFRGLYNPEYKECPFSYSERGLIEDFFWQRLEDMKSFAFILPVNIKNIGWWSKDLINKFSDRVVDYGKSEKNN